MSSFKKLKKTKENILPQYSVPTVPLSDCSNCSNCGYLDMEIKKLTEKIEKMEDSQFRQNKAIMEALAEQKVLQQKLIRQESVGAPIADFFPLQTEETFRDVEKHICLENREIFVSNIKRLVHQNFTRNFKNILSDSIVLSHNVDGTHGKKRLKSYEKFYAVLLDSISQLPNVIDAEDHLRKAIRMQKKRNFKMVSLSKTP